MREVASCGEKCGREAGAGLVRKKSYNKSPGLRRVEVWLRESAYGAWRKLGEARRDSLLATPLYIHMCIGSVGGGEREREGARESETCCDASQRFYILMCVSGPHDTHFSRIRDAVFELFVHSCSCSTVASRFA